uniref:AMP-dependent synthetase/ligase domain-containing protein n=1 Tax=Caenorhabditis japonica TaxID=281687 RepID=A0A8R1DV12_CAEJA
MPKIHPKLALIDAENGQKIGEPQISEKVAIFTQILKNSNLRQNDVIFIYIPRSFDTILAIISCLKLGVAFTFCRENGEKYERFRTTVVFDGREARRIHENSDEKTDKICYVITTSGTTGARKQVAVPVDCIQRNIDDFCSLFSLTPSDTILFSTSLLFDPSIVELFLAFQTGSTLILTPDAFRSEPHRMQSAIEKYRPTVAQFTPTVLEMLPSLPSILSDNTSLRILLIGGSHFPLQLVRTARSSNNPTRVFNVYGVTEISCWATVFEVETDCDEVLIGLPIGGSTLEIEQHGELVIGGPRQCYVNGKKAQKHYTGDRVERVGEEAIRIVGRVDRVVKHRGVRICLDHLTTIALRQNPHLHTIHVIHHLNRHLIQFTVGPCTSSEATTSFLTLRIDANTIVNVTVVHVPVMPINSSGKVDEKALLEILENLKSFQSGFREVLENKFNISLEDEQILDSTFVELGLKSLLAAEISTFFDENIQGDVIRTLLDATTSIREFLRNFDGESKITIEENRDPEAILVKVQRRRQPRMKWAIDLKKCIDGNVLVVKPRAGQFIVYPYSQSPDNKGIIHTSLETGSKIEKAKREDCIRVNFGLLIMKSWIAFSDDPAHKTFDLNLAFADWYGSVDSSAFKDQILLYSSGKKRVFNSLIIVNDLKYKENGTQLFKVHELGFPIVGKDAEVDEFLQNMNSHEKSFKLRNSSSPLSSNPTITNGVYQESHNVSTHPGILSLHQVVQAQTNRNDNEMRSKTPTPILSSSSRPASATTTTTSYTNTTPLPAPMNRKSNMAIAMNFEPQNDQFVIWIFDAKQTAIMKLGTPGSLSIKLGSSFECIIGMEGENGRKNKVLQVVRKLDHRPFAIRPVSDNRFLEAEILVDLCSPNEKFNIWTLYTGVAVLNAPQVGSVTTADSIETPTGDCVTLQQLMRTYMGNQKAHEMIGYCRLEEQRVPRGMIDSTYVGADAVVQYAWRLYRVGGSVKLAQRRYV